MQIQNREHAYKLWGTGDSVAAGQIIFEQIPVHLRPEWAASVLELFTKFIGDIPEIALVRAIACNSHRWAEAHDAFDSIRRLTLKTESQKQTETMQYGLLHLAENVAKVIYNCSGKQDTFDEDCGYWLFQNAQFILSVVKNDELNDKVQSALFLKG